MNEGIPQQLVTIVRSVPYKITEKRRNESRHSTKTHEYRARAIVRTMAWKAANKERILLYERKRYARAKAEQDAIAAGLPIPHFDALPRKNTTKKVKILAPIIPEEEEEKSAEEFPENISGVVYSIP